MYAVPFLMVQKSNETKGIEIQKKQFLRGQGLDVYLNSAMQKKTWLFRIYRGLYFRIIW